MRDVTVFEGRSAVYDATSASGSLWNSLDDVPEEGVICTNCVSNVEKMGIAESTRFLGT